MDINGYDLLIEALKHQDVKIIFSSPDDRLISLYEKAGKAKIELFLTKHGQGAVFAADGYARCINRTGVVLASSGSGVTDMITGLANAYMDSVPLVIFTYQVSTSLLGTDSYREVDTTGITLPIVKHSYLITDGKQLPHAVQEAFLLANTGRKGPVVIDLPDNILAAKTSFKKFPGAKLPGYNPNYFGHKRQIVKAVKAIEKARKPVILAGGGILASGAEEELLHFAERGGIPVTTSLMGLSCFPGDHPLFLGMSGMHGTYWANSALREADLIFSIGARFDERVTGKVKTFAPDALIVHVDIDPAEIGKNIGVDVPIVGDAKMILEEMAKLFRGGDTGDWVERIKGIKHDRPITFEGEGEFIQPQEILMDICRLTRGRAIITTDVGQHQMWTAQYYTFKNPRSFITSGGLGAMGYGFPASLGVQMASKDQLVFCITGDGSFQMSIKELGTMMLYKLPIKIAILNNCCLGMVKQLQQFFMGERYFQVDLSTNPDFVKLAASFGIPAWRVTKREEVSGAIEKAIAVEGPALLEFLISREENVYPMIPPDGSIEEIILGEG